MTKFLCSYFAIYFLFTWIGFTVTITPDAVWRSLCLHRCQDKQIIKDARPGCIKPITQECFKPCFRPCNTSFNGENYCKGLTCRKFANNQKKICRESCSFADKVIFMNLPYNQSLVDPLFEHTYWNTEENLQNSLCNVNNPGAMKYIARNLLIGNEPFRTKSNDEICTCSINNPLSLNISHYIVSPIKSSVDYKDGKLVLQVQFQAKEKFVYYELRYFLKKLNDDSGAVITYCNITKSNVATAILHQPKDQLRYNVDRNNDGINFIIIVVPSVTNLIATTSLAKLTPAALEYLNPVVSTISTVAFHTENVSESNYVTSDRTEKDDTWKWLSVLGILLIAASIFGIYWHFRTKLLTGENKARKLFRKRTGKRLAKTLEKLFLAHPIRDINQLIKRKNFLFIVQYPWKNLPLRSAELANLLGKSNIRYTVPDEIDDNEFPTPLNMVEQPGKSRKIIIFLTTGLVETVADYRRNGILTDADCDEGKDMVIFFWIAVLEVLRKHRNSIDIILVKDSKLDNGPAVQNGNKILGLDEFSIYDLQNSDDRCQIRTCLFYTIQGDRNSRIPSTV
ncbi:uncharacterized protein TRIADDRAFT_61639 [Trichoplax adhaerens]|uniref:SEFIR domain-containing protein n=1 Tax=Trichoplax adhaerens TaxID=10228 RepID=B3SBJ6_TRIAD|nr:predicted protein [Trichoplax adhaerens]EDV19867.1 predicted protein [Trichoplax adhaerens]|eukprot:XP_002117609.1 predicted protein [Trichoplax adhaerens]